MNRGMGRFALLLCCLLAFSCAATAAAQVPYEPPPPEAPAPDAPDGNPAERFVSQPIDDYARDEATGCRAKPMKGTVALVEWLEANVRGESWGTVRCERGSLHGEGRAVDWHLDTRVPADRRAARRLIRMLLATDSTGNEHALARRMGVQELIFDCQSWWIGAEAMGPYSLCYDKRGKRRKKVDPTQGHVDHVHIGLNRAGARMRTSFWAR